MLSLTQWLARDMEITEEAAKEFLLELLNAETHIDHKGMIGTCNLCILEEILIEYSIYDEQYI